MGCGHTGTVPKSGRGAWPSPGSRQDLDDRHSRGESDLVEPISPIPQQGGVFFDPRDEGRFLRVSHHPEADVFVLSWWRDETCLGTFRLATKEAPRLIHTLTTGLVQRGDAATSSNDHDTRDISA